MSSFGTPRDTAKIRLSRQRSAVPNRDTASYQKGKQISTNSTAPTSSKASPASSKAKNKRTPCASVNTPVSDAVSSSANVAKSTSLSESSAVLESRPSRTRKMIRKAPLPAAARRCTLGRNASRRVSQKETPPVEPPTDDGWDADLEQDEPVVTKVQSTTRQETLDSPMIDEVCCNLEFVFLLDAAKFRFGDNVTQLTIKITPLTAN
jgi:hypothetical protein